MNPDSIAVLRKELERIEEEVSLSEKEVDRLHARISELKEQRNHLVALIPSDPSAVTDLVGINLSDAAPAGSRQRPPRELILPNGERRSLRFWKGILVEPARYLVHEELITERNCPISKDRSRKEVLVDTKQPNPSTIYSEPVDIGAGFWIETHGSAYELWEKACFLIERCGDSVEKYRVVP